MRVRGGIYADTQPAPRPSVRLSPIPASADKAELLNSQAVDEVARLRAAGGAALVPPATAAALYANRAAAILMGGDARTRQALADCFKALEEDPSFQRARVRALGCLFKLGMFKAAKELWEGFPFLDNASVCAVRARGSRSKLPRFARLVPCVYTEGKWHRARGDVWMDALGGR